MKRILTLLLSVLCASFALAQTPAEILAKMDQEVSLHEAEGVSMVFEFKVPIVGTISSQIWTKGEKARMEFKAASEQMVTWMDETTQWTYNSSNGEVTIEKRKPSSEPEGDLGMFQGLAEGYDLSLTKETDQAWYIHCKKSRTNKSKDDPKTMDLVIAKGTYRPISLSAKLSGVTLTLREIDFGVSDKQVTFNPADYPNAKTVDKR